MTPERVLHFARRIAARFVDVEIGEPAEHSDGVEHLALCILPILQEAIVENTEDHLASVLVAKTERPV